MNNTNKLFVVILACISVATLGLQVPVVMKQKGAQQDSQTSSDLAAISTAVTSKYYSDYEYPDSLGGLDLEKDVKSRVGKYEYTSKSSSYELCAQFKTDTTSSQRTKADDIYSSYSVNYYSHTTGRVCFTDDNNSKNISPVDELSSTASSGSVAGTFLGTQAKAKDTKIQTDINSMHAKLEEYFNTNNSYPTFGQFSDSYWRKTNLVGIDEATFKGPNGEVIGKGYTYNVSPANCENTEASPCNTYNLNAKLSSGESYTKNSLN